MTTLSNGEKKGKSLQKGTIHSNGSPKKIPYLKKTSNEGALRNGGEQDRSGWRGAVFYVFKKDPGARSCCARETKKVKELSDCLGGGLAILHIRCGSL